MSPPRKNTLTDAQKLENLENLEGASYDLVNMAGVTWDILAGIFDGQCGRDVTTYTIDPGELDRLYFAVSHTWEMARQFKDALLVARGMVSEP